MTLLLALLLTGQAHADQGAELVTIREGECYAMVQNGSEVVSTRVPGLHVIEATGADGPFRVTLPARTGAVACPPVQHHPCAQ